MNFVELMSVCKLFAVYSGIQSRNTLTKIDIEIASEALKKFAEGNSNWTQEEKAQYKSLVDLAKELTGKNNAKS